jgi:hypothetical protein
MLVTDQDAAAAAKDAANIEAVTHRDAGTARQTPASRATRTRSGRAREASLKDQVHAAVANEAACMEIGLLSIGNIGE